MTDISRNLWRGQTIRLTAITKEDWPALARWYQDAGFLRLWNADPARPQTEAEVGKWLEEETKKQNAFFFAIRPLEGNDLLGQIELDGILWNNGTGWLAIGLGNREDWGKGYGGEAMRLVLDYAFSELNLHRVQLTVFAYNARAILLYEKLGFVREGTYREFLHRDGVRYDMYLYGLLRREWETTPQIISRGSETT
jgi:RimJ/RimL family protein N-acetyltransferase